MRSKHNPMEASSAIRTHCSNDVCSARTQARDRWFSERSEDPTLTDTGEEEVSALARVLEAEFGQSEEPVRCNTLTFPASQTRRRVSCCVSADGALLLCSPMLRAVRTAAPIAGALKTCCTVHPELYEVPARAASPVSDPPGGAMTRARADAGGRNVRASAWRLGALRGRGGANSCRDPRPGPVL